jgi:hypothetical protein
MPFEKIDATKKIQEALKNDPTFAKGFDKIRQNSDLWWYFLSNHRYFYRYDGCCNCCDCLLVRKEFEEWEMTLHR